MKPNGVHVSVPDIADVIGMANVYVYTIRLHVGLINGNSINYYESGEIKPFRVITNLVK